MKTLSSKQNSEFNVNLPDFDDSIPFAWVDGELQMQDAPYGMVNAFSGRIVNREERNSLLAVKRDVRNEILGLSWDELERKQGGKLMRVKGGAQ